MRTPVIEVLTELKYYEAIDPLIRLAASPDAAVYEPALNGLRGIADPDEHDVPRLVTLLLKTPAGRHRDDVERTITVVCEKLPAGSDRAELVLAALGQNQSAEATQYLPLLGRLGGPRLARSLTTRSPVTSRLSGRPRSEHSATGRQRRSRASFGHWPARRATIPNVSRLCVLTCASSVFQVIARKPRHWPCCRRQWTWPSAPRTSG